MIHGAALGRRQRGSGLGQGNLRAGNIDGFKRGSLASGGTEILHVPPLRLQRIRHHQVDVVHLQGSGDRLVFVNLDADAVRSHQETLSPLRIRHRLPVQPVRLPFLYGRLEVPDVKAKVVDGRPDGTTGVVLFAHQNVDARKLHHGELFSLDNRAADGGPEARLGVDIAGVEVNVSDGGAAGVGRGELRRRRRRSDNAEHHDDRRSKQSSCLHSAILGEPVSTPAVSGRCERGVIIRTETARPTEPGGHLWRW